MTYELAKQLKDAKFPFKTKRRCEAITERTDTTEGIIYATQTPDLPEEMNGVLDIWLVPTLSELIEECGEDFYDLQSKGNGFWFSTGQKDGEWLDGSGYTPEEAVAKLWLSLNNTQSRKDH